MIYRLSDIMDIIGGGTPKTSNPDYWDGDIPWLSVKDFNNDLRYVYNTEKKITKLGLENSSTKFLNRGDMIISARGTVGEIASIPYPMTFNQSCYGLRAKKNIISSDYLYYLIKYNVGKLQKKVHGSVFDTITRETFSDIEVDIPGLEIQNKIVSVLCDIDAKIQLNVTINRNLSEQCDAIYRDQFITKSDSSWTMGYLSDLITVKYGKDHKKLEDGDIPCYGSGGVMRYVERPIYDHESVLIPRKGTLNNVMYVNVPFWSVDTMFYTVMKISNVAKFVYHYVKGKNLASMNAGSAVPSMTVDILNAMELQIPSSTALAEFETIVQPLYKAMKDNEIENKKLAELRDTLLPKLMSGELDVSDLDI